MHLEPILKLYPDFKKGHFLTDYLVANPSVYTLSYIYMVANCNFFC